MDKIKKINNLKNGLKTGFILFLAILLLSNVASATVYKWTTTPSPVAIVPGFITTNWTSCVNSPDLYTYTISSLTDSTTAIGCSSRYHDSYSLEPALDMFFNTSYSVDTNVQGNWYFGKLSVSNYGYVTVTFNLTYVLPTGTIMVLPGGNSTTVAGGSGGDYNISLAPISGVVPAGAKLGLRISKKGQNSNSKLKVYVGDTASQSGQKSGYFSVSENAVQSKLGQTITFGALSSKTYGDPDFGVSATASSELPVSFTASGTCTITGSTVSITGAGSCTVTANQSGNATYNPAPDVSQGFTIAQASSSVTVTCPASATYTGSAIESCTASYSGAGGLSGSLTPTYTNNVVVGTATASATYAGDANHAGSSNSATFGITPATATITLSGLTHTYDGTQKSATATTTPGGLTVVLITYDGSPTAPTALGSYAVIATLTNDNYEAVPATGTMVISSVPKIDQTITFGSLSGKIYGDAAFDVSATASSELPVSFSIVSGPATVSGSTITITGAGLVTVRASQAGNDTYNAAPNVDQPFTVAQAIPIITWSNPADITYGTALGATQLNAGASVPGVFVYTPAAGTVLSPGAGQILHAAFTPSDPTNYTVASKDVLINVTGTLPSVRYINGTVIDSAESHTPLAGVTVSTTGASTVTDASGKYSLAVASGSYPLTASYDIRYYTNSSVIVSTEFDVLVNQDIELQLKPIGTISGAVTVR